MKNNQIKSALFFGLLLSTTAIFAAPIKANSFQCKGQNTTIEYSSSSFSGEPLLSIVQNKQQVTKRGTEIQIQQTVLGNLISVMKSAIPDFSSETLTILLPDVNVSKLGRQTLFSSKLFITQTKTSIDGSDLVVGKIQSNQVLSISCKATAVVF